jgi:hypothetical protein
MAFRLFFVPGGIMSNKANIILYAGTNEPLVERLQWVIAARLPDVSTVLGRMLTVRRESLQNLSTERSQERSLAGTHRQGKSRNRLRGKRGDKP